MITDMKDAKIFQPLQLGRTTLKNRIAMAPMSMHYEATNGTVPKQLADIFVRRAEGGAGYVTIDVYKRQVPGNSQAMRRAGSHSLWHPENTALQALPAVCGDSLPSSMFS